MNGRDTNPSSTRTARPPSTASASQWPPNGWATHATIRAPAGVNPTSRVTARPASQGTIRARAQRRVQRPTPADHLGRQLTQRRVSVVTGRPGHPPRHQGDGCTHQPDAEHDERHEGPPLRGHGRAFPAPDTADGGSARHDSCCTHDNVPRPASHPSQPKSFERRPAGSRSSRASPAAFSPRARRMQRTVRHVVSAPIPHRSSGCRPARFPAVFNAKSTAKPQQAKPGRGVLGGRAKHATAQEEHPADHG